MASPGLIWRTIRPLGWRQPVRRVLRPLRGVSRRAALAAGLGPGSARIVRLDLETEGLSPVSWTPPGAFSMLGVARDLGDPPDWTAAPSRLWSYHLHYLEPLADPRHPRSARATLLRSWVAGNPPGSRPGWEPYPLSLRLVNTLEFLAREGEDGEFAASAARQAWWLEGHLERELGANHLMKNAVALVWAGRIIDAPGHAARWRETGDDLLAEALERQFLADGFHYERSPAYHAIAVEDLLRLDRLFEACGEGGSPIAARVGDVLARAAAALESVLHLDGDIPLFNDAAIGQAPRGDVLVSAVRTRLGEPVPAPSPEGAPAAGLHRLEAGGAVAIFDAGAVAPDEQPGHAHADTLSFELSFAGRRVVVDAGVSDYTGSGARRYARSTAAHNTVTIDGADQSEMWGVFRVGRRAVPRDVRRAEQGSGPWIEAAHDGYMHRPGEPVHRRRFAWTGSSWRVEDTIEGRGRHTAVGRLRFHPDFAVRLVADGAAVAEAAGVVCHVTPAEGTRLRLEQGRYFPSFGRDVACAVVAMEAAGALPLRLGYDLRLRTTEVNSSR